MKLTMTDPPHQFNVGDIITFEDGFPYRITAVVERRPDGSATFTVQRDDVPDVVGWAKVKQ
jgi:hypothetical protein